jgi:hypothetical protein
MATFSFTFKKRDETGLMKQATGISLPARLNKRYAFEPGGLNANDNVILFAEEMFSERVVFGSTTRPSR